VFLYTRSLVRSGPGAYIFSLDESVYAEVLGMNGWDLPVTVVNTHPDPRGQPADTLCAGMVTGLTGWLKKRDLLFNLTLIAKRNGTGRAARTLLSYLIPRHHTPVLLYNSGYNWDDALCELYQAGICPVYRISDTDFCSGAGSAPEEDRKNREYVKNLCRSDPAVREFSTILGIDVAEFLNERISGVVGNAIGPSIASYRGTRELIRKRAIRALLHSVRERAAGHAIIQAARDEGIPVVSWQHGGAGYCYHPIMPFIEFINSDWHFVFGEGVQKSYQETSEKIGLEKIPVFPPVGSSSLEYFRASAKKTAVQPQNRPVVYITTHYLNNLCPISLPCDLSSFNESLWNIQQQMMSLAKRHPEKQFLIKLHPNHTDREPLKRYLADNGIGNVALIMTEMTIRELTDMADVLVFDLISTGILQVLTSDRPVFVYSGLFNLDDEVIRALKKRTCISDQSDTLIRAIEEYLCSGQVTDMKIDRNDPEFVTRYGTGIHDQPGAQAAVEKLRVLLSSDKNR
jgi:hypothetical protein